MALSRRAAKAINALLVAPIGVLPGAEGDTVHPFRIWLGSDIEGRLKPEAALSDLRKALRRYTQSAAYYLAVAQPDACRYDMTGEPVEAVSEQDRHSFTVVQERRKQRRKEREMAQQTNEVILPTGPVDT